ncbi:hypothetical protein ACQR1H_31215 [Bradyrhizobium sp. HKCCYLRH2015]|uniref:hypothetical protein n=1 Tax=Bradyrhizobium TaxID=374 RepID=UPI003EBECDD4
MLCKMRSEVVTPISANLLVAGVLAISSGHAVAADHNFIVEAFPDAVQASIEIHQKQIAAAAQGVTSLPNYLIVPTLNRWQPASTVKVAFSGGDNDLRSRIERTANEWTKPGVANIKFQFRQPNGSFLEWSEKDQHYSADIRVAFNSGDRGGYWSHVGRNSVNGDLVGGRPNEGSLNLDSFDKALPGDWQAVVIHEFGHALGFQHEHQNPVGGCDFRFEDDAGYIPTKNAEGWYVVDVNGRRPGLYTYLGGYKNYWPRTKVDANLRAIPVSSAYLVGQFDKFSIMKYVFSAFMFVSGENSPCYTSSENLTLSDQDKDGARQAYPSAPAAVASAVSQKKTLLNEILASPQISAPFQANVRSQLDLLK